MSQLSEVLCVYATIVEVSNALVYEKFGIFILDDEIGAQRYYSVSKATYATSISAFGSTEIGKVAVTAVARKLLTQLNAVARRLTPWVKLHSNCSLSYRVDTA